MKKNFLIPVAMFFSALLLMTGCQKETIMPNEEPADLSSARQDNRNECRLTSVAYSNGGGSAYHYNQRGLCNEWTILGLGTLKQEYDNKGRLKISRIYDDAGLFATIHFFYTGNNVTKEIWYYGNTNDVYDEVHYIFNNRGQNVRMESAIYDYHTINQFDAQGNVKQWDFYSDGIHVYFSTAEYNYRPFFKNPNRAIPGIDYGFPYLNAATFGNKECISTEKVVTFDEDGNPIVLYDYDPRKTSYQRAAQNYPSLGRFFDRVTNAWTSQAFQYENCGGDHGCDDANGNGIRDCDEHINISPDPQTFTAVPGGNKDRIAHILHPALKGIKARMSQRRSK